MAAALTAQEGTPTFQTTTELVLVDVQVLHTRTRSPAASLRAQDLRLFEEGMRQEILHFSRDEFPLSVVFLFDLTESARGVLTHLAEGAKTALAHFKPEDQISVMAYSSGASLIDGFTTDRGRTLRAIEEAAAMKWEESDPCGPDASGAHFNEALYQAAVQLRQAGNPASRRVVIWLTDNLPNVPHKKECKVHTELEALRALHEEGVLVTPILMKSAAWALLGPIVMASEARWRKAIRRGMCTNTPRLRVARRWVFAGRDRRNAWRT